MTELGRERNRGGRFPRDAVSFAIVPDELVMAMPPVAYDLKVIHILREVYGAFAVQDIIKGR